MTSSHKECADDYARVIHQHGSHRVIRCKDNLQWIVQRRRARCKPGGAAWDAVHYCATREALARLYRAESGQSVCAVEVA